MDRKLGSHFSQTCEFWSSEHLDELCTFVPDITSYKGEDAIDRSVNDDRDRISFSEKRISHRAFIAAKRQTVSREEGGKSPSVRVVWIFSGTTH